MLLSQYLTEHSTLVCMKKKFLILIYNFYCKEGRGKAVLATIKLQNIFLCDYLLLVTLTEYPGKNVLALSSDTYSRRCSTQRNYFHPLTPF